MLRLLRASVCLAAALTLNVMAVLPTSPGFAAQTLPSADAVRISSAQNATIGLIAGSAGSTDARIAADMAQVLDDGDKLRVLPILGQGSVQNITDLIYLKGIDVAIVHTDVLAASIQQGTIPRENSVQYIAKLFPEEVHILARQDIARLEDLNGKAVSIGVAGSGTEVTASALLDIAHITPNITRGSDAAALDRLRHGEIAAMIVIGGEPVPMLQTIEPGTGLHFLPIPLTAQLVDSYLPTSLDHQNYPNLVPAGQPIDSVAVSSVLITLLTSADSLRAKRVNRFVDTLFARFGQFRQTGFHPKWREVNLAAQIQGWTRYSEAQTVLKKDQSADSDLKAMFGTYLNKSGQTVSGMDSGRREALFRDFLRWRDQHSGP